MADGWEGQAPTASGGWEGTAPTNDGWEGQAPSKQTANYSFEAAPEKTTVLQDLTRGAKTLAQNKVAKSSMAAVGLSEVNDRTILGLVGNYLREKLGIGTPTRDQILENMTQANKAIEEGSDSGEGIARGPVGTAISAAPTVVDMLAQGAGSGAATVLAGGADVYGNTARTIAEHTDSAAPALVGAIPQAIGMAADIAVPLKFSKTVKGASATGTITNPLIGLLSDKATQQVLELFGETKASLLFDPFDVDQRGSEAIIGGVIGGVVKGYHKLGEATTAKKAKAQYDALVEELDAYNKENPPAQDVDASQIKSPYMKPKTYKEAQAYADATNEPGNRELNPTIKSKKPVYPVGLDDADMASAMRTAENDQVALEKGWTGDEPGIGKGEVLEDVDTTMRQNPFLNNDQAYTAQQNELLGKGPGYGEMDFAQPKNHEPVFPTSPDAEFFAAIKSAVRSSTAKGSLEKARAKSDAAADKITADLAMDSQGVEIKDSQVPAEQLHEAIRKANKDTSTPQAESPKPSDNPLPDLHPTSKVMLPDELNGGDFSNPTLPPDVSEARVAEVSTKILGEIRGGGAGKMPPSGGKMPGFMRKQSGAINLGEYTGIGFRDFVEGIKRASVKVYNELHADEKVKFLGAHMVDENGIPVMLFHGTDSDFKHYEVTSFADGGLIHFGTIDSATIIKDRRVKSQNTYKTLSGESITTPSLMAYIGHELKTTGKTELTNAEIKVLRERWEKHRIEKENEIFAKENKNIDTIERNLSKVLEQHGSEKVYKLIEKYMVSGAGYGMGEKARGFVKQIEKIYEFAGGDITDFAGVLEYVNKNPSESLNTRNRILNKEVARVIKEARKFLEYYTKNPSHSIRPLFTSMKNPIWMRDLGIWSDLNVMLRELADVTVNEGIKSSTTNFAPIPFRKLLTPEQSADFKIFAENLMAQNVNKGREKELQKRLYKKLEELGFDGFIYENRAESLGYNEVIQNHPKKSEINPANTPTFSLGTWKPELLHDLSTLRRREGVLKSQGGFIDKDVLIESAKKVAKLLGFKKSYDHMKWMIAKANADVFESGEEVLKTYKPDPLVTPDLPKFGKNLPTVNQLKLMMDHPWFNFVFSSVGKFKREANTRFVTYADALHDVFALDRKNQLSLFKSLIDIQTPELKEGRRMAEATNTREQFLLEQGIDPKLVPHAIKVLNVLKHSFIKDNESTARAQRSPFELEPMYFPKTHSGAYNVVIRTDANDVQYATGFDSGKDAQQFVKNLKDSYRKQVDDGKLFIELRRNHFGQTGDVFAELALNSGVPEGISQIAAGIEKSIDSAKRTFELHRAHEGVGGFIGERLMDEGTMSGRLSNDKVLNLLQNRLRASHDWEVRSKVIHDIKTPFFDDISILHDYPTFRNFAGQFINRELGHDIGAGKIEQTIQDAAESASKQIDKLHMIGSKYNYEGGDLALISPKFVAQTAQTWTYITSFMKLAVNPPVLAANATAIPLVFLDGSRTAAKEHVGQHHAIAAYFDTLVYAGLPKEGATKFMQEAMREGMIEPHISEQYDLAETGKHASASRLDQIVNSPRNIIEKGTNFTAILYYYNFYKRVAPGLSPEAFKTKVYETARSYTGDYSLQAGPMIFSQAGAGGRLMSNFAKWKWNQLGRFADDLKDAKNGHLAPIAINMATQVLVGGLYGATLAVDYEALRRLGKLTTLWDWKPFGVFMDDVQEWAAKEHGIDPSKSEWARRGVLTRGLEMAGESIDVVMPDISGTMRHSSALESPMVAPQAAFEVFVKALPATAKMLWQLAGGKTTGVTTEDESAAIKGLPTVTQNPIKAILAAKSRHPETPWLDLLNKKSITEEGLTHGQYNEKGIYRRTPAEQTLALLNLRTTKENNYSDKVYRKSWETANRAAQISDRVKGILKNQDNQQLFQDNIAELATIGGAQTAKNIIKQLKDNAVNKNLSADEQAAFAMLHTLDPTRKKFLMEQLIRLQESDRTSSNR